MKKTLAALGTLILAVMLVLPAARAGDVPPAHPSPATAITITLVDPVPMLLAGSMVTTNYNALATKGRVISGAAADGVAEVVVRFPASSIGASYTVTLLNDQGQQSNSVPDAGDIAHIGATGFPASQITLTGVNTTAGPMGFLIYRAPADFPRTSGQDANSTSRIVSLMVQPSSGNSTTQTVTLLRPPVVLIHGLWGSSIDWNTFTPFITDPRFAISYANYGQIIGNLITKYTPAYPVFVSISSAPASSLGYSYNAGSVLSQISSYILTFKSGTNPLAIQVAAVQADLVDHSMGGDVTRWLARLGNYASNSTFAQGSVHKVVTISTPHLGSPLATMLLENANTCARNTIATFGSIAFNTATLMGKTTTGGVNDLQGDGFGGGLSAALTTLSKPSPHPLPFGMIDGIAAQSQFDALNSSSNAFLLRLLCGGDPLANNLTGKLWYTIFNQPSDAIVPEASALNNLAGTEAYGVIHDSSAETIGFGPPAELEAAGGVSTYVETLLNTNVTSSIFYHF